jgi:hypothetical protein
LDRQMTAEGTVGAPTCFYCAKYFPPLEKHRSPCFFLSLSPPYASPSLNSRSVEEVTNWFFSALIAIAARSMDVFLSLSFPHPTSRPAPTPGNAQSVHLKK